MTVKQWKQFKAWRESERLRIEKTDSYKKLMARRDELNASISINDERCWENLLPIVNNIQLLDIMMARLTRNIYPETLEGAYDWLANNKKAKKVI